MDRSQEDVYIPLTEDQCWNLLDRGEVGHLAVSIDGEPEIFPINYVTDGPRILFRTAPGSKLAELSANPQVSFEVDEYDETSAASVIVKGVARQLETQSDVDVADALPLRSWVPTLKYRWVCISPSTITGRRFARGPEPDRYVSSTGDA